VQQQAIEADGEANDLRTGDDLLHRHRPSCILGFGRLTLQNRPQPHHGAIRGHKHS
jgi:hypothetical protein